MTPVRVGVTGHLNLTLRTSALVHDAVVAHLHTLDAPVLGVTCLAAGADQLFARAVLAAGGTYEVVLPAPDYATKIPPADRAAYHELLTGARHVLHSGVPRSGVKAYAAANHIMLGRIDLLLAVWDGGAPGHAGGTGEVVALAGHRGIPTTVVWPPGAERT